MKKLDDLWKQFRITPGEKCRLANIDPAWTGEDDLSKSERKELAEKVLSEDVSELSAAQELLYADNSWAVLVIFQAMDAAGKDSTIKHVMSGVNPQGCQVYSFKHPSPEELEHNFLWRCAKVLPERGRIGIFNRSYYEEVLIVKVHPELVVAQRVPGADPDRKKFWNGRYEDINHFERHLTRNGTRIIKFFLHISKEEQRKRFLERLDNPQKHWKFSTTDVDERRFWDDYMDAYEEAITQTSTKWAPWYVIPADHKWITRALVAKILSTEIGRLKLSYPPVTSDQEVEFAEARRRLDAEA